MCARDCRDSMRTETGEGEGVCVRVLTSVACMSVELKCEWGPPTVCVNNVWCGPSVSGRRRWSHSVEPMNLENFIAN